MVYYILHGIEYNIVYYTVLTKASSCDKLRYFGGSDLAFDLTEK